MTELQRPAMADSPIPFGSAFTPSMLTASYTPEAGWAQPVIEPRGPLVLDPATMALHYGQAVFEGLKAWPQLDGGWALFRARSHAERLAGSCSRLAIPAPDLEACIDTWRAFIRHEAALLPADEDTSIYVRPLIFGTDVGLGARPSATFQMVVLGVLGQDPERHRRFSVFVADRHVRTAPGGIGMAKTPGNYAAAMLAMQAARESGCDQVLWLDAGRRRWIEEMGSMNVFFVIDGVLVTPPLTDTILAGVTRDALLTLAREAGLPTEERPVALEEITAAMAWRGLTEAFAASTGVGIASIGSLCLTDRRLTLPAETPVADQLRAELEACQRGLRQDHEEWRTAV